MTCCSFCIKQLDSGEERTPWTESVPDTVLCGKRPPQEALLVLHFPDIQWICKGTQRHLLSFRRQIWGEGTGVQLLVPVKLGSWVGMSEICHITGHHWNWLFIAAFAGTSYTGFQADFFGPVINHIWFRGITVRPVQAQVRKIWFLAGVWWGQEPSQWV